MSDFDGMVRKLCEMSSGTSGLPLALVGVDVDRIHDYVFATSKPMEIAGASRIVEGLEKLVGKCVEDQKLPNDAVCYVTGGSGLLLAPASVAEPLCKAIQDEYRTATVSGSCTAAFVLLEAPKAGNNDWFGPAYRRLSAAIRRRKDEKALDEPGWQAIPGYLLRCQSCGRHPATEDDSPRYKGDERLICPSCLKKRQACRDKDPDRLDQAHDLAELVRDEKTGREDDIAVIYCDARGMGDKIAQAGGWEQAKRLSQQVKSAFDESVSIAKTTAGDRHYLSLVAGGDDLLLLVPARSALSVVTGVRENLSRQLADTRLDIGLLIADAHLAARYLVEYARALMKSAKHHGYELLDAKVIEQSEDAIDYMVIKGGSPLNRDIAALRREHLVRRLRDRKLYRLTRKPYRWSLFEELSKHQAVFADVPGSQLKALAAHLLEHPEVARLNVTYQIMDNDKLKSAMKNVDAETHDKWGPYFVADTHEGFDTGFFDLLELLELGKEKGT
jgi:hypothetical protein